MEGDEQNGRLNSIGANRTEFLRLNLQTLVSRDAETFSHPFTTSIGSQVGREGRHGAMRG